jgi:hypothetical protein
MILLIHHHFQRLFQTLTGYVSRSSNDYIDSEAIVNDINKLLGLEMNRLMDSFPDESFSINYFNKSSSNPEVLGIFAIVDSNDQMVCQACIFESNDDILMADSAANYFNHANPSTLH